MNTVGGLFGKDKKDQSSSGGYEDNSRSSY